MILHSTFGMSITLWNAEFLCNFLIQGCDVHPKTPSKDVFFVMCLLTFVMCLLAICYAILSYSLWYRRQRVHQHKMGRIADHQSIFRVHLGLPHLLQMYTTSQHRYNYIWYIIFSAGSISGWLWLCTGFPVWWPSPAISPSSLQTWSFLCSTRMEKEIL